MAYYKQIINGYIECVNTGGGTAITEEEYNTILSVIHEKPTATETTDYRLRADLTWEEFQVDPPDPDPEINDDEVLQILIGGVE